MDITNTITLFNSFIKKQDKDKTQLYMTDKECESVRNMLGVKDGAYTSHALRPAADEQTPHACDGVVRGIPLTGWLLSVGNFSHGLALTVLIGVPYGR